LKVGAILAVGFADGHGTGNVTVTIAIGPGTVYTFDG
jgi:hypothetical protein